MGAAVVRIQLLRIDGMRQRLRESLRADRRRDRQIAAVERIGRILANAGPTDRALGNVVAHLSEELGFRYVAIYLGDRELSVSGRSAATPSSSTASTARGASSGA